MCAIWNNRLPGEELTIVLHSCEAGKVYGGMGATFTENLSIDMPDVIIVALNENIYWNYGNEFAADDEGNIGYWIYYKDGVPISSKMAILKNNPDRENHKKPSHTEGNTKEEQQAQYDKGSDKSQNTPKKYEYWGPIRRGFYDLFGF